MPISGKRTVQAAFHHALHATLCNFNCQLLTHKAPRKFYLFTGQKKHATKCQGSLKIITKSVCDKIFPSVDTLRVYFCVNSPKGAWVTQL